MMLQGIRNELIDTQKFFHNTISCFTDEHSDFRATEECLTVVQHIAHAGQSINWFFDGAFAEKGFDLNFEKHWEDIAHIKTLSQAKEFFDTCIANALEICTVKTEQDWKAPIADGPIMGGLPRIAIISGVAEHTAHHRGALAVYARLLGMTPKMPYDSSP